MPSKPTKSTAKKSAAKKATKAAAPKKAAPAKKATAKQTEEPQPKPEAVTAGIDPKAQEAGQRLTELLDKATETKAELSDVAATKKLAAKLAKGTASNADLCSLRDAVNAISAALREAKQRDLASKFSDANKGVRRAERATREGRS